MKKLILTIMFLSFCTIATSQDLEKGKWIDLTKCQKLGNNNPICTGDPLMRIMPVTAPVKENKPVKTAEVKENKSILIPVPRYIGKGKYCNPLPNGDDTYKWQCPKDE